MIKHRHTRKRNKNKNKNKNPRIFSKTKRKYHMKQIYGGQGYNIKSGLNMVGSKLKSVGKSVGNTVYSAPSVIGNAVYSAPSVIGNAVYSAPSVIGNAVYSAPSAIKNTIINSAQEIDDSNEAGMTISEKMNKRSAMTNALSPFIGFARNASANVGSVYNTIRPSPSTDLPTESAKNGVMTEAEKINVKNKLKQLNDEKQITDTEYNHAIQQLDKKDGVFGIGDSVVSVMSPIQSIVKVVGDFFIKPAEAKDIHGRQTIIKLLKFPASSKTFVKHNLGHLGKDPELDEYMVLVKESFNSPADKISSDLLGVDNLLANVINGCIGAGCKDGKSRQTPGYEKTVEFTDNVNKKKLLNEMKKNKLKEEEDNNSRMNQT